jgi:hypothetical protein
LGYVETAVAADSGEVAAESAARDYAEHRYPMQIVRGKVITRNAAIVVVGRHVKRVLMSNLVTIAVAPAGN